MSDMAARVGPHSSTSSGLRERQIPAQPSWTPEPVFTGTEHTVTLSDVELACWESSGDGPVVVLLHPHTGSGAVWGYQHDRFASAGFRVISYSRRGYFRSTAGRVDRPGTAVDDLHGLLGALDVGRFHLVGSAGGGYTVLDYALHHPDRVLSCTLASTLAGIDEPEHQAVTRRMLPPGWEALPPDFQEVGPSYRAANPAGVDQWLVHARAAVNIPVQQPAKSRLTWSRIEQVRTPTMLIGGDADLYQPPTRMRQIAQHLSDVRVTVLSEAGHAPFWEQYIGFNETLLSFVASVEPAQS